MIWFYILTIGCYVVAIFALWIGFKKVPVFLLRKHPVTTKFSVIIVFRNEAEHLPALLQSLQQVNYPSSHFEVIFVNDASTDASEEIVRATMNVNNIDFQLVQNTSLPGSFKKQAIALAISTSKYDWIITTDADCTLPANWLSVYNDFILENNPYCIAAPVAYHSSKTLLDNYQLLDNLSLQGVTVGSFGLGNLLLSNGANFAYRKTAYNEVGGFKGNMHIASGDDMFLLEKFMNSFPEKIQFMKSTEAVVHTQPVVSWKHLVSQRIRWASKTKKQNNLSAKLLGVLVFLTNLGVVLFPVALFLTPWHWPFLVLLLLAKLQADFFFMRRSAHFLSKKVPIAHLLVVFYLHAAITVYVVIASLFANYTWKQRSYTT